MPHAPVRLPAVAGAMSERTTSYGAKRARSSLARERASPCANVARPWITSDLLMLQSPPG